LVLDCDGMGLLTDYISAALKLASYRPGEGGFLEVTVPGIAGLMVRGRSFEECRERLQIELELWLTKTLLAHEPLPEMAGVGTKLQEMALEIYPSANPTEATILQNTRLILDEVRQIRRGGGGSQPQQQRQQPEAPKPEPKRSSLRISEYVGELGLSLQLARNGNDAEEKPLERISSFLGERYVVLEGFYDKLKVASSRGSGEFQYSLTSSSQQDIGIVTQFCTLLKENNFLKTYSYNPKQRRIYGRLIDDGKVRNFITGGWLERFVKQSVLLSLRRRNIAHDVLAGATLIYPNSDRFEIDLLARTANTLVMVECKTGGYEENLERHQRIAADLRIPAKQVLYVLLSVPEQVLDELGRQWGFTFANEKTLVENLERMLA
jgi:predicted RNase H-like HicB family nuclease